MLFKVVKRSGLIYVETNCRRKVWIQIEGCSKMVIENLDIYRHKDGKEAKNI